MSNSTSAIHPTAIIDPSSELADDVRVGAYAVIGPNCVIGAGTVIGPQVVIEEFTHLGDNCRVRAGAVLGGPPQDNKFKGERSYLKVGSNNRICEFVTLHRATGEEAETLVGNDNLIMAYAHVGHNSRVGNGVTMANNVALGGHATVEDAAVIGGLVGIHQFVRIGKLAMVGSHSKVPQDVPPFMLVDGRPADVLDLNVVGLRRAGIKPRPRAALRHAYKLLYRSNLNVTQALAAIEQEVEPADEVEYLVAFMQRVKDGHVGPAGRPAPSVVLTTLMSDIG
jgi:UDP-N-acetylglucosamine acyltransferase